MPRAIRAYVRLVDAVNRRVGGVAIYLVVVLLAILLYSGLSKATTGIAPVWTVEMATFTLSAYYLLGGGFTLQNHAHVRMDLFYSRWSPRTRAIVDSVTVLCLIAYLSVLLYGSVQSAWYAFETGQRRPSAWGPELWPIRSIMTIGIVLMLLQAVAFLFRTVAAVRGEIIE